MKIIELFAGVGGFRLGLEKTLSNKIVWSNQWEPSTKIQHASDIYVKNFGNENHSNEDIAKVDIKQIPNHDMLCGGFPCFIEGTKVLTKTGYKNIEDITTNDSVLTHNNKYKKVIATMNQIVNVIQEIKVYGTPKITTTKNHPFYVIERNCTIINGEKKYEFSEPKWIEAKYLEPNKHFIGININNKNKEINFNLKNIKETNQKKHKNSNFKYKYLPFHLNEFYWFIGRYLADGWYQDNIRKGRKNSKTNKVFLCCSHQELNEVEEKIKKLELNYTLVKEKTVYKFIFSNFLLSEFIKIFGKYAYNKFIPKKIQDLPEKYLSILIEGYLSGDGSVIQNANDLCKISTVSEKLAYSFQNIVHKVYKLPCRISFSKVANKTKIENKIINQKNLFTISFRKNQTLQKIPYLHNKLWFPIKKKTTILNQEKKVYNIEVEKDNSYTVQNLICHNCQDYSVARPKNLSNGLEGKKGVLWWEIYKIIKEHNTNYLFLENVDRLLISPSKQKGRDFAIILKTLSDLDYIVEWRVINAADYGFPQKRKRTYILAYKKDSLLYNKFTKLNILEIFNKNSIFNQTFKIKEIENENLIQQVELKDDIVDISNNFNKNNKINKPFYNYGILINNIVYTFQVKENYKGNKKVIKDILLNDNEIPAEFFITKDEEILKWKSFKDKAEKPRMNKKSGICYVYKQGQMDFPESIEKPSRTIITSEGQKSASRTTHVIKPNDKFRRLHPIELERLNGFPDNHTQGVSNTKRGFLMGNALIVGIVEEIGKTLEKELNL